MSAQLVNAGLHAHDITVFDPSQEHHYQPAYTMVGGGVLGNAHTAKSKESTYLIKSQQSMFVAHRGVNWVPKKVTVLNP